MQTTSKLFFALLTVLIGLTLSGVSFAQRTGNFQMFNRAGADNSPNVLENIYNPLTSIDSPMSATGLQMEQIANTMDSIVQKAFSPMIEQNSVDNPNAAATTVTSAIDGQLVVENSMSTAQEILLPPITGSTNRYPPRMMFNISDFPKPVEVSSQHRKNLDTLASHCEQRFGLDGRLKLVTNCSASGAQRQTELVIKGTVDSERQSRMIEMLVQMSPGIDKVRNELAVIPSLHPTEQ
jgi:hypothetical protein